MHTFVKKGNSSQESCVLLSSLLRPSELLRRCHVLPEPHGRGTNGSGGSVQTESRIMNTFGCKPSQNRQDFDNYWRCEQYSKVTVSRIHKRAILPSQNAQSIDATLYCFTNCCKYHFFLYYICTCICSNI